jgi:hypothetical protein
MRQPVAARPPACPPSQSFHFSAHLFSAHRFLLLRGSIVSGAALV